MKKINKNNQQEQQILSKMVFQEVKMRINFIVLSMKKVKGTKILKYGKITTKRLRRKWVEDKKKRRKILESKIRKKKSPEYHKKGRIKLKKKKKANRKKMKRKVK